MHEARHVGWDGFFNTRDLGGLPTRDGRVTRPGAYFRSADLRFVTPAGWSAARAAGVRTIVDLRNDDEIGRPESPPGFTRREIPLDDSRDVEFWRAIGRERLDGSPLYYPRFLRHKPHRCAAAVTALARAGPGGVLFHCGVGRDRTGLVTLLLLALVDVEPAAIAEDYELSVTALAPLFAALGQPDQAPMIDAILARRGTTLRAAILAVLDDLDAEAYLRAAGVAPADLAIIRERLVTGPTGSR